MIIIILGDVFVVFYNFVEEFVLMSWDNMVLFVIDV